MPVHEQRVIRVGHAGVDAAGCILVTAGGAAVASAGGVLFGVFKGVIGLSTAHLVAITEWPDAPTAEAGGHVVLSGLGGAECVDRDLWQPAPRPAPGERATDTGGYYSHRAFDIPEADWPRFQELSVTAWDNFEGAHKTRVVGFWTCQRRPAPGLLRVRLMAWYASLDAWERSRWWNPSARSGSDAAFERFRERADMLRDTSVSILQRIES